MNLSLVRSWHAVPSALLVLAFALWAASADGAQAPLANPERTFQIAAGWAALVVLSIAYAYVVRKYAHKRRWSPEFLMRRDFESIERAHERIRELRPRIVSGALRSKRDVERAAARILREERVHRIDRARVVPGGPGEPPWIVQVVPTEPLGRVRSWMHVHLFWGTAFGILLLLHSRLALDSPAALLLTLFGLAVWATGVVGLVFWIRGPALLTRRERDLSIEEAHSLSDTLERKLADALAGLAPNERAVFERVHAAGVDREAAATRALEELRRAQPEQRDFHTDLMSLVVQADLVGAEYSALRGVRRWIFAWKLVHVPAAIVLAALVVLHVLSVWKY